MAKFDRITLSQTYMMERFNLNKLLLILCLLSTTVSAQDIETEHQLIQPDITDAELNWITLPKEFIPADNFNGYVHKATGTIVYMKYIEHVLMKDMAAGMTEEFYKRKGLTPIRQDELITHSGMAGISYKAKYQVDSGERIRHTVFIDNEDNTLWIHVTYPIEFEKIIEPEVLKSIASIDLTKTIKK